MIKLEKLSKHYSDTPTPALQEVSLQIDKGSIFGILGRSGAGKSTLLRCLNLLERPTSGEIFVDGQNITRLSVAELRRQRQQMGMIFQHFNLLHSLNVAANIALPLEIAGMPAGQRRQRVKTLLQLVGLEEFAAAWPSQLSGGQKQRVGIARALAVQPDYLLCDEATSALDPETTLSILDLLADIQRQLHITVVLITHEMTVVKRICHGAALLEKGRLIESGSVSQIMANPQSRLRQMLVQDGAADRAFLAKHHAEELSQWVA
ncbi:ATP-binding cassette domain-containing protein [Erwiniaceae bacterium BAC15a-03b]|uniref:Cell division ATP-binding protein FtsE n=1 Tax=Winslowiella arboricola TaxID=2978220 RepID=A0A9J6PIJ0_9GAMM|nr:ATP-binding cassette domain-containing protein [Winslowiella arboricola]MCU5771670.1 ATP-binding cassette domain-containing protein [Winslowiella arboricola]MCU5778145.1 ATP-binding cassette domain-containing protein [Winslowiella arboricola]